MHPANASSAISDPKTRIPKRPALDVRAQEDEVNDCSLGSHASMTYVYHERIAAEDVFRSRAYKAKSSHLATSAGGVRLLPPTLDRCCWSFWRARRSGKPALRENVPGRTTGWACILLGVGLLAAPAENPA